MKGVAPERLVAVLDSEALQAIADLSHPKHRSLMALVTAASQRNSRRPGQARLLTTTAVRVESRISRQPTAALVGMLRIGDSASTRSAPMRVWISCAQPAALP